MNWNEEHGVQVAEGRKGWYVISMRAGCWKLWAHSEGQTGKLIGSFGRHDLEYAQADAETYDAKRRR